LNLDRGLKGQHKTLHDATDLKVYFCDRQSPPWQRRLERKTRMGLLRQYFPRRTDLLDDTQAELDQVGGAVLIKASKKNLRSSNFARQ